MRTVEEHEYTTYPRRFNAYRWYKPLLVGILFFTFYFISMFLIDFLTKTLFGVSVTSTGYDDMDFFSAAGAFDNGARAAVYIPCMLLAALAVRDRPISSYFSSMGGWRWKVFLRAFAAAFVILGIPLVAQYLFQGKINDVQFTIGGFLILALFLPLQGIGEELLYRGYFMQMVSSWFILPIAGMLAQVAFFTSTHSYNIIGLIEIAVSAIVYALACVFSKGLEAPSALHIVNNVAGIYMAGFGFGQLTSEQTLPSSLYNLLFKILFCAYILYASKKLHWFDEVQYDDVEAFNAKRK